MNELDLEDVLEPALSRIEEWCREHEVPFAQAHVASPGLLPEVHFNHDCGDPLGEFLDACAPLAPAAIFVNVTRFDETTWRMVAHEWVDGAGLSGDDEVVEALRSSVGHVASVECRVFTGSPRLVFCFDQFREWFDLVYSERGDMAFADGDDYYDDVEDDALGEREEVLARRVSEHLDFYKAKNAKQRRFVVNQLLKDEPGEVLRDVDLWRVQQTAEAIFELEGRTQIEALLAEKIATLKGQGKSQREIAQALGLPITRVRQLS